MQLHPEPITFLYYFLVFLGTLLEGEFTLIFAGIGIYKEVLNPGYVMLLAFWGAFIGDWLFFELGRHKGAALLAKYPKIKGKMEKLSSWLTKRPLLFLFILRFQIGMRMFGTATLGQSTMSRGRFLLLNVLACILWAVVITAICQYFAKLMVAVWRPVLGV